MDFLSYASFSDAKSDETSVDFQGLQNIIANLCTIGDWLDNDTSRDLLAFQLIHWTHRQLNSTVGAVLLAERDPSTPQKLLTQMDRLLQSHILPNFLLPYVSEMWVVNRNRLLCLHFGGLSHDGDQRTYVEEDISMAHNEILSDHKARRYPFYYRNNITWGLTTILDEAQYTLSLDRAQVFTHLLEYHLLFLVKKFYSQLNPESDPSLLAIQIPDVPFLDMFIHSYPTEKILAAFRGLYYIFSNSNLVWQPQIGFCLLALSFLKKYDLHTQEKLCFEKWLGGLLVPLADALEDLELDSESDSDSD